MLERRKEGTSFNNLIAAALIGMGMLDGMHALVHTGNTFVWLHSLATLTGGILFLAIWIPTRKIYFINSNKLPFVVLGIVLTVGICSLLFHRYIPIMVIGGVFTKTAKSINIVGGLFLFLSAVKLGLTYRENKKTDDFLFFLHCSLFGAAAVMFEQSQLWDATWWGWHVLRMLAYIVAILFVIHSQLQADTNYFIVKDNALKNAEKHSIELEMLNINLEHLKNCLEKKNKDLIYVNSKLKATHEQLLHSEKLASIGKLSASIAHEFNNPVCGIKNVLEIISENDLVKEEKNLVQIAVKDCKRISTLVHHLQYFNQPSSGVVSVINLHNIIDNILNLINKKLKDRKIIIEKEYTDSLPEIKLVEDHVQQVLLNLIQNAEEAIVGNNGKITITTEYFNPY